MTTNGSCRLKPERIIFFSERQHFDSSANILQEIVIIKTRPVGRFCWSASSGDDSVLIYKFAVLILAWLEAEFGFVGPNGAAMIFGRGILKKFPVQSNAPKSVDDLFCLSAFHVEYNM